MAVKEEQAAMKQALKEAKSGQGQLWMPVGWPVSRTLTHNEGRIGGDEYGHTLTAAEQKAWKTADQEGNKYNFVIDGPATAAGDITEGEGGKRGGITEGVKLKEAKEE